MIGWLDFAIFGSGHGLAAPRYSQVFYWLIDDNSGRGEFYTWCGWFGSQLQSFQWAHPLPGEERVLGGEVFRPAGSRRRRGRVRVSWVAPGLKTTEQIARFEHRLTIGGGPWRYR